MRSSDPEMQEEQQDHVCEACYGVGCPRCDGTGAIEGPKMETREEEDEAIYERGR